MDSPNFSDSDDESTCSNSSNSSRSSSSSSLDTSHKPVSLTDLGKRVVFTSAQDKKQRYGVLRFVGEPEFSEGTWCGVVLDQPQGKNNGSVHGIRYFTCEPNYGVFVPIDKVEVDTTARRSRSRPNSQPGSRASSVERKGPSSRPSSASKPQNSHQGYSTSSSSSNTSSVSLGPTSKMGISMQQHLVNRLSQPIKRHAQSHSQVSQSPGVSVSRRLPMKAFAPKAMDEVAVKENRKPLMPFRSGGMYKASSSENLRAMKGKDKIGNITSPKLNQGMPAKKSSSERDLRNTGKSTTSTKPINSATLKPKKKPVRNSSCSNILAPPVSLQTNKSDSSSNVSRKISCEYTWPRTSTPGNRDELTPDGCSSPEETDDSFLKMAAELQVHECHNNGFVEPPLDPHPMANGKMGTGVLRDGLSTHAKQFAESELASPSLSHHSAQSPERMRPKHCYSNRVSGSATLAHPLSSSIITDGGQLLEQLLGNSSTTLEGVSVEDVVSLLNQQIHQWYSVVADLEEKLDNERARSKVLEDQLLLLGGQAPPSIQQQNVSVCQN